MGFGRGIHFGFVEGVTDLRRRPGELKPLWRRLIAAALVSAAIAVLVSLIFSKAGTVVIGLIGGLLVGLMGLGDDDPIRTLRVWIRAYEDTDQGISVGIYTVLRHKGIGYLRVGFPLPEANFTATLMPFNNRGSGLLLKTMNTGSRFPGHYISDVDIEDKRLTTIELTTMDEEIDVNVEGGRLKTEHRFYFSGSKFLTFDYRFRRIDGENGA